MRRITNVTACVLTIFCMVLLVPIASGKQTSGSAPQPVALAIPVKMIDLVDSSLDPAGKQYRAGLTRPVNIGNGVIVAQGSAATVVLVKNGSGWNVQLSSLMINDQVTGVTSNPGTLIGAAADNRVAAAANAANAILGPFGRKQNTYSPVAVVAMGERVILTPGISLNFVLNAIPTLVAAAPTASPMPAAPAANAAPVAPAAQPPAATPAGQSAPAQARTQPGTTYLCSITTDTVLYRSGVFHVAANTDLARIQHAFENYLRKNYHLSVLVGGHGCADLVMNPDGQFYIQQIEQPAKASKMDIIRVDWTYTPGQEYATQPPAAAAAGQGVGAVGPSPQAATYLVYCSSLTGPVGYVSEKFEVPSFEFDTGIIQRAFHQFLHEKYSLPDEYQLAPVGCGVDSGPGGARRDISAVEANVEASAKEGKKIVKTGWKYAGPPAAAAPAYTSLYFCNTGTHFRDDTIYFSATFAGPKGVDGNLEGQDFAQFVKEKYSVQGDVVGQCHSADSLSKG